MANMVRQTLDGWEDKFQNLRRDAGDPVPGTLRSAAAHSLIPDVPADDTTDATGATTMAGDGDLRERLGFGYTYG